jgi:hypothetical protein
MMAQSISAFVLFCRSGRTQAAGFRRRQSAKPSPRIVHRCVPESRLSFDPRGIMPLTMNPLDEFPETSAQSHPHSENHRLAFPSAVFSKPRAEPAESGLCLTRCWPWGETRGIAPNLLNYCGNET